MKCSRCQEPCSQRGHIKGQEITRIGDKHKTFLCVRCGVRLEQPTCECCGEEIGLAVARAGDHEEAAKRMAERATE
jgi:hypothetical protein